MKVIKFGGTSVGEAHAIEQICYILRDKKEKEERYVIIVSAVGGITENLVKCAQYAEKKNEKYHLFLEEIEIKHIEIIRELFTILHKKSLIIRIIKYLNNLELFFDSLFEVTYLSKISLDRMMHFGELLSSYILNEKLKASGFHSNWKESRKFIVSKYKSLQSFTFLTVKYLFIKRNTPYIIFPGFVASEIETEITTLSRGGSDSTASLFSAAIQSENLEIWTDVSGIMTAHPQIVSKAFPVKILSYREAIEISYFGGKIIYPPTLLSSMDKNIPILILNTFSPLEFGTLIFSTFKTKSLVTGISGIKNITSFSLKRKLGMSGYFNQFKQFAALSSNDIFNLLIKQSSTELCIEKKIIREFTNDMNHPLFLEKELCLLAIIISDMKNIPVTSGSMFSALGKESINLYVIGSMEKNIYTVIAKKDFKKSMNTLHDIFFDKPYKRVHIFLAGLGQVGNKLIEQLNKQKEYLVEELHVKIRVIGICNSKIMLFDILGINLNNWQNNLKLGTSMILEEFIGCIYNLNLINSIFVDATASKDISNIYADFLGKGISVVTCNKISCASFHQEYKNIKNLSKLLNVPFFFGNYVGATLAVVEILNSLIENGDKIHLINSIFSVSMNFIFNKFKGPLIEIIKEAIKRDLTESDPLIDLSGIDVIRKILLLGRECGESIEIEDIKQISFLPKNSIKAFAVDNFYQELIYNEDIFRQLRLIAKEQRKCLRLVAKYKDGETSIELEYIEFEHPFYKIEGKDNIILYITDRYANQPLIVKGLEAGSEVTAAGVLFNIIKASI